MKIFITTGGMDWQPFKDAANSADVTLMLQPSGNFEVLVNRLVVEDVTGKPSEIIDGRELPAWIKAHERERV